MSSKSKIVVTGFGPFHSITKNTSWEAVKLLPTLPWPSNIDIEVVKLDVNYRTVDYVVPRLWETHKPALVVHVGVAGSSSVLVESCALRKAYQNEQLNKERRLFVQLFNLP
ncbi:hypothetical protein ACOME3_001285 [Neoechinorhynchus agilis]